MAATKADLHVSLSNLHRELHAAGYPLNGLALRDGVKTAGLPWRLVTIDPDTGAQGTPAGLHAQGFLGTTRTEAVAALDAMTAGLRMAATARTYCSLCNSSHLPGSVAP